MTFVAANEKDEMKKKQFKGVMDNMSRAAADEVVTEIKKSLGV